MKPEPLSSLPPAMRRLFDYRDVADTIERFNPFVHYRL
jgi:hypothetical protein